MFMFGLSVHVHSFVPITSFLVLLSIIYVFGRLFIKTFNSLNEKKYNYWNSVWLHNACDVCWFFRHPKLIFRAMLEFAMIHTLLAHIYQVPYTRWLSDAYLIHLWPIKFQICSPMILKSIVMWMQHEKDSL